MSEERISQREIGELVAGQKAMQKQMDRFENYFVKLFERNEAIEKKLASGRSFLLGAAAAGGIGGASITGLVSKMLS